MKGSKERFLEEIPAKLRHLIADLIDMEQWTSLGASSPFFQNLQGHGVHCSMPSVGSPSGGRGANVAQPVSCTGWQWLDPNLGRT